MLIGGFFKFYTYWDWSKKGVSLVDLDLVRNRTRHLKKSNSVTSKSNEINYKNNNNNTSGANMRILQSVYPYHNTCRNVNEQARDIISKELGRAHRLFNTNKEEDKDKICNKYNPTSAEHQKQKYISFAINCQNSDDIFHIFSIMKAKTQNLIKNLQRIFDSRSKDAVIIIRPYSHLFRNNEIDSIGNEQYYYFIGFLDRTKNGKLKVIFNENEIELLKNESLAFITNVKSLTHTSQFDIIYKHNFI
jgi:poly(A) polymerase Pap1